MHTIINPPMLDRIALFCSVFALALALLNLRTGRGRIAGFAAIIGQLFAASASAFLSWNGHDWIPDDGDVVRLTALCIGVAAFAFLWLGRKERKPLVSV